MDRLWAPWRCKYVANIGANEEKECVLCSKPKAKDDKSNYIVSRSRYSFAILNLYPYNNGHMMIVPYRHIDDIAKLTNEETLDMLRHLKATQALLSKVMRPDGYNIGINIGRAAGAGIKDHVHIHIVPRWVGDVNFMPVMSSTRVISESLDVLYGRLKRCLRAKR